VVTGQYLGIVDGGLFLRGEAFAVRVIWNIGDI